MIGTVTAVVRTKLIVALFSLFLLQYFTNWIRKSSSFIPISKYFSVKCLK